jgi:hypothetical protein
MGVIALFRTARIGHGKRRLLMRGTFGEMMENSDLYHDTPLEPLNDPSYANQDPVDNDL